MSFQGALKKAESRLAEARTKNSELDSHLMVVEIFEKFDANDDQASDELPPPAADSRPLPKAPSPSASSCPLGCCCCEVGWLLTAAGCSSTLTAFAWPAASLGLEFGRVQAFPADHRQLG